MKRYLQVKTSSGWKYVFCRNELKCDPITTDDRTKAIVGDAHALDYFQSKFGNCEFRIF